jgi:hypothetical protein
MPAGWISRRTTARGDRDRTAPANEGPRYASGTRPGENDGYAGHQPANSGRAETEGVRRSRTVRTS